MVRQLGVLAAVAAALAAAPAALADAGSPNYSSKLMTIEPKVKGLSVRVVDGDDAIQLRNATGRNIMVPGYEQEPYLRFLVNGRVEVNLNSPAKYLNEERYGGVTVPKTAGAKAKPKWELVAQDGSYTWHEHRIHWMSTEQPPRVKASGGGALLKIFDWVVPLKVGAEPVKVSGRLWWVPTAKIGKADALIAAAVAKEMRQAQAAASAKKSAATTPSPPAQEAEPAPAAQGESEALPAAPVASDSGSRLLWLVIAVLALALAAAGAYVLRLRRQGEVGTPAGEVW